MSNNSSRIGYDQVAHSDSSNDIGESSSSFGGASCDLVNCVAIGDQSNFDDSTRVGSEWNDSSKVGA